MNEQSRLLNVVDVEATCWEGRPPPGALHIAGLPLEGRTTRGADDAWNIAALILDLVGRDTWRITTTPDRGSS